MFCMLSENIKKLRISKSINQVAFAKAIGVTKQCVSNWENDNVVPSIEMLCKIADFFGVSTDYLLGRSTTRGIDVSNLSANQVELICSFIKEFEVLNGK